MYIWSCVHELTTEQLRVSKSRTPGAWIWLLQYKDILCRDDLWGKIFAELPRHSGGMVIIVWSIMIIVNIGISLTFKLILKHTKWFLSYRMWSKALTEKGSSSCDLSFLLMRWSRFNIFLRCCINQRNPYWSSWYSTLALLYTLIYFTDCRRNWHNYCHWYQ